MPWKVDFKKDSDDPKASDFVGEAMAVFTDDAGQVVASYSARIQSDAGVEDFVKKAKAFKDAVDSNATKSSEISQKIESLLNG